MHRFTAILVFGWISIFSAMGQSEAVPLPDTVPADPITFTDSSAAAYIRSLVDDPGLWRPGGDTIRRSLQRLLHQAGEPFDSVEARLAAFPYDSVKLQPMTFIQRDTLPVRWLNDSTMFIDTAGIAEFPFITEKTTRTRDVDTSYVLFQSNIPDLQTVVDTVIRVTDTIITVKIDSAYFDTLHTRLHRFRDQTFTPPLLPPGSRRVAGLLPDSTGIFLTDTIHAIIGEQGSPFYLVPNLRLPDSLRNAVMTLLEFTASRDSIRVHINNIHGEKTPFWLTTGSDDLYRYWVKNYKNDSITVWLGNPSRYNITLILEEDVNVNRIQKEVADDIPIVSTEPKRSLAKVEPLKEIPVFWDYSVASSLALNQTYLSNWSKGGENALSSMLDIKGEAKHTNKAEKTEWTSNARLKYGTTITEEHGLRTNTDMFIVNSQYNKVIKNKIDFSSIFYMKHQVAKGYKYPNDSVVVSKFLNPGTFTIGVGVEYKPFKKTSLNFSPLSYKNTFVMDTARIDQTAHGIEANRRTRQEMGGQLLVKNSIEVLDGLKIDNAIRLFSSYLNKPQNIDVDWELNLEKRINWYFTILMNFHIIYDDDIRFPLLDENEQPLLWPDGSARKAPKMQFKEFMGITLSFRF
ncbi:MAG: DUF3078 domain-containing protein [Bacteroidales bacterium]